MVEKVARLTSHVAPLAAKVSCVTWSGEGLLDSGCTSHSPCATSSTALKPLAGVKGDQAKQARSFDKCSSA